MIGCDKGMALFNLDKWFCRTQYKKIAELEKELQEAENKYNALLLQMGKDQKYYIDRIAALEKILARSIELPEVKIGEKQIIDVHNNSRFKNYNMVCADWEYYKLPLSKWKEILYDIQFRLAGKNWRYVSEIFDCDDFALFLAGIVAYVAAAAALNKQVAFAIAWSLDHAFNLFIDIDENIWIYEPQNNSIIGKLGETSGHYDVKMIWFMG